MQRPTRRQFVASAGTTALAATAGVFYGTAPARAVKIDVQQMQIDDQHLSSPDAPDTLPLRVSGDYQIEANVAPDELRLNPTVAVASSQTDGHEYPTVAESLAGSDASGTFEFTVDLKALYGLRDSFPQTEGESADYQLTLTLGADVTGPGGDVIGSAEVSDGFVLTLTHEEASADVGLSATAELVK